MAPSTVGATNARISASAAPASSVPRIRPVIPLGFSRPSNGKKGKPPVVSPSTPPPTELSTLQSSTASLLDAPLTPDSTPSITFSQNGSVTPADSVSDPSIGDQSINGLNSAKLGDVIIDNNETPISPTKPLDPQAHFVPRSLGQGQGLGQGHSHHNSKFENDFPVPILSFGPEHFHPPYAYPDEQSPLQGPRSDENVHSHVSHHARHAHHSSVNLANLDMDPMSFGQYLSKSYCNPDFADFTLAISSHDPTLQVPGVPAHGLLLGRSPTMRSLMFSVSRDSPQRSNGLPLLQVHIEDSRLNPHQLLHGISLLYGHPLPIFETILPPQSQQEIFTAYLAFAAAGRFLQVPYMVAHGVKTAMKLLTWLNVDQALGFVNDRHRLYSAYPFNYPETEGPIHQMENNLLRAVIQFLAYYFPVDFAIHTTASELVEAPRLPGIIESRPSVSHNRLSSIQFGEVSVEDAAKLDESMLLSSILLSIPTHALETLFNSHLLAERLGWDKVGQIALDTIAERERRRIKVQRMPAKRVARGASKYQWETVQWEERLERNEGLGQDHGLRIMRSPVEEPPQ